MTPALERERISTKQQKIAELARRAPQRVLLTLAHHIDLMWMEEAYRRTRKDGAVGVDGVTAAAHEERLQEKLQENLSDLLERFKSGLYRAPPVRRVHIPKDGTKNKTRPIGIPTLEDKILQRAVLTALEPVYEQDFLDCSYGFRPGRSAHQALEVLWQGPMAIAGGWVIDLDIQSYFDITHYWGRSRKGRWVVQRKTARTRFSRAVRQIGDWCPQHRHPPVAVQQQTLSRKLRGHDAYYGLTGKGRALARLRHEVRRQWRKWLNRRSQAARLSWAAFARLVTRYPLPPVRVVHSIYAT